MASFIGLPGLPVDLLHAILKGVPFARFAAKSVRDALPRPWNRVCVSDIWSPAQCEWAVAACGLVVDEACLGIWAYHGDLDLLRWAVLRPWCPALTAHVCEEAALGGELGVLQWARANGCEWDSEVCRAAAGGGHLAVLRWARENGCEWDFEATTEAAGGADTPRGPD